MKIATKESKREVRLRSTPQKLEIRANPDGSRTASGHAAVWNSLSEDLGGFREKISPGAFKKSLRDAGAPDNDPLCLYGHDMNNVLGRVSSKTLTLAEDATGLRFSCRLPDTQLGRDVATLLDRGDVKSMSFGFVVMPDGDVWEQDADGNVIRTLTDVSLMEVSIVSAPAYTATSVSVRSCPVQLRSKLTRDWDDDSDTDGDDPCDPDSSAFDPNDCEDQDDDECRCECRACAVDSDCSACVVENCSADDCDCEQARANAETEALRMRVRLAELRARHEAEAETEALQTKLSQLASKAI